MSAGPRHPPPRRTAAWCELCRAHSHNTIECWSKAKYCARCERHGHLTRQCPFFTRSCQQLSSTPIGAPRGPRIASSWGSDIERRSSSHSNYSARPSIELGLPSIRSHDQPPNDADDRWSRSLAVMTEIHTTTQPVRRSPSPSPPLSGSQSLKTSPPVSSAQPEQPNMEGGAEAPRYVPALSDTTVEHAADREETERRPGQRPRPKPAEPPGPTSASAAVPTPEVPPIRKPQMARYGGGRGRRGRARAGLSRAATTSQPASVADPEEIVIPRTFQGEPTSAFLRDCDEPLASTLSHPLEKIVATSDVSISAAPAPFQQPFGLVEELSSLSSNHTKRSTRFVDLSDDEISPLGPFQLGSTQSSTLLVAALPPKASTGDTSCNKSDRPLHPDPSDNASGCEGVRPKRTNPDHRSGGVGVPDNDSTDPVDKESSTGGTEWPQPRRASVATNSDQESESRPLMLGYKKRLAWASLQSSPTRSLVSTPTDRPYLKQRKLSKMSNDTAARFRASGFQSTRDVASKNQPLSPPRISSTSLTASTAPTMTPLSTPHSRSPTVAHTANSVTPPPDLQSPVLLHMTVAGSSDDEDDPETLELMQQLLQVKRKQIELRLKVKRQEKLKAKTLARADV